MVDKLQLERIMADIRAYVRDLRDEQDISRDVSR